MKKIINAIIDKERFERELDNVGCGYYQLIKVTDTRGYEHLVNPKYIAWIDYKYRGK